MRSIAIALVLAILPGCGPGDAPAVKQGNPNNPHAGDQANKANQADDPAAKQGNADNSEPGKAKKVQELPKELVAAWTKADASFGWMAVDLKFRGSNGWIEIDEFGSATQHKGYEARKADTLPAFRFTTWKAGVVAMLPPPKTAFGLSLQLATITDTGLKELAGMPSLQLLDLYFTPVTDTGMKELAGLQNLQALCLSGTQVTDVGLKELAGLRKLQSLNLFNTKVTDAGLKELAGLKNLHSLILRNTQVTDAGLKELAGLQSLQSLDLCSTQVTDAGMKELAGLKSLQSLNLWQTQVTDARLKELAGLKSLQSLNLNTKVRGAGVAELQKALPTLKILR